MKNTFIKNTIILIIGGFITKILGMLIKIIMTRELNPYALSLYMLTLPSYNLFITLVSQGMIIAISKLVSENIMNRKKILSTSIIISLIISFLVVLGVIPLSKIISNLMYNKDLYYPILSCILSLPFIGISTILKGYFLGKNKMHVQVISNFIEQIIRISLFLTILPKINNDIIASTFIIGSNLINEVASVLVLSIFLPKNNFRFKELFVYDKDIRNKIFSISIPSTISRIAGTISYFIEPILLTNLLILNGFSNQYISSEYTIITAYSMQLLLLPSFFSMAISQSIIPVISKAYANSNFKYINKKIKEVLILSSLIGFIYITIILINPRFFLTLIYNTNEGVNYIRIMAPIFILLYIQGPLVSILQSINESKETMKATIIGIIIKTILIIILSFLKLGIYSYIIPLLFNIIFVTFFNYMTIKKKTNFSLL